MWDRKIRDMPKLESPFVRKMIGEQYVVTPEIAENMRWVFEDSSVLCTEKLDGTNVSIVVENGTIASVWNRTARIPIFGSKRFIIDGLLESWERGYCSLPDGQHFGELIGPKVNGNPYNLDRHMWIPFDTYVKKHLVYKSWGKYPKDFDTISAWLKDDIFSLFVRLKQGSVVPPEGIVFVHPDGRMAKLRRDMFDWAKERGLNPHKSKADMEEKSDEV
jgi:hypothetical protein